MLKIILSILAIYLAVRLLRENQTLRNQVEKHQDDGNLIEGEVVNDEENTDKKS